jgi:dienelactone hydrolase
VATTLEHFKTGTRSIGVDVFIPPAAGRHPGCLILHGTFGLLPPYGADIVAFGEALAGAGVVAMLPHYFDRTGTAPGPDAAAVIGQHLPAWLTTCGDAMRALRDYERVAPGRLGAIGFSLGGHLALRLAMDPSGGAAFKGVVDFFGPTLAPPLVGDRAGLPPVQIHHGTADAVVDIRESEHLVEELRAAGKVRGLGYDFFTYDGQGHGFTGADLATARSRTVDFISTIL